jgi:chromosome partitioning protein
MGHRVLLADLDEQANVTQGLGVSPAALGVTINDLFANPSLDPRSVIIPTQVDGLHLLPGHPNLAKTETGMTLQRADPNGADPILALKDILSAVEDDYDYMVLDTPPSIKYMTNNALAAADRSGYPGSSLCVRRERPASHA